MARPPPTPPPLGRERSALPTPESTKSFWHSEPSPLLIAHRTTRELPSTADVVIVGSGITGTSVAYHILIKDDGASEKWSESNSNGGAGPSVVMLEAREACWGATGRNGGHCQPLLFEHPHDPSIPRFELANFHALQDLINDKSMPCEFVEQHGVRGLYSRKDLNNTELALLKLQETAPDIAERVRIVTDQNELHELRIPTAVAAVVTNVAARLWPYKLVSYLLTELLTSNYLIGEFNLQTLTPATTLHPPTEDCNSWKVETARGSIAAKKVVLATNAYTSHLLPSFSDLIVPCRGQMSALKPPSSLGNQQRLKNSYGFLGEGLDDYLIQRPNESGGHLMFGGGRQAGAPSVGVTNDDMVDEKTARYLRRRLIEALDLPEQKEELTATHEWTGIMGFSRDDLPWVGPVSCDGTSKVQPGLFMSAGYTGHGMPNAWLCGKAAANMVRYTLSLANDDPGLPRQTGLAMLQTINDTRLPNAYWISEERIRRAIALEDVGSRDWAEMERARARSRGDRPPSGYA